MLIANSFLLMATTYAKNIDTNPANAQQEIKSVHFIEWEKEKVCSLVLFDISWSMWSGGSSGKINGCYVEGDKRNNAVNWAINYSRNFLNWTPENEIWLILFWNNAYYWEGTKGTYKNCWDKNYNYWQQLSNNPLEKSNFWHPWENTYLYKWLDKAYEVFQDRPDCTKKIAVIITDWVPSESSTTTKNSISKLKSAEVTIYSVGYGLKEWNGSKNWETILSNFFEWFFYNADAGNIDDVFEKTIWWKNDNISVENNKLKINSDNFILTKIGEDIINQIEWNSLYSNILWGESHLIASSESSTIIAWQSNSIQLSLYSTILWWQSNKIVDRILADNNENNAILWWYKNNLKKGKNSVIIWWSWNTTNGEYTAIAWNNSTVVWKNSVALWNKTKISANNSFYWTDTSHAGVLKKDNVFAVVSNKWMAVNTNNPNANAQLTINWSLVVIDSENDTQIQCGDWNWNGILKVVKKNENEKCFCSCDWSSRKSLYNWSCEYLCNTNMKPVCWTTVTLECKDGYKMYSGSCNSWVAINTSYYVTSNNKVHWACQTYDGKTVNCSWTLSTNNAWNCDVGGETSKCTSTRPQTCPEICSSPAISFSLNNPNYGNGTSNDPIFQINSKITECVNSCGTPATKTCDDVTWVNCCKN